MKTTNQLRVNGDRLLTDLRDLSEIGKTVDGGVNRPSLSDADLEARRWLRARAEAESLLVHTDSVGNISIVLPSAVPKARTVMFGSHMDSVPNGGRFDGALGVCAALEVLRTVRAADLNFACSLEATSFTDEEGAWCGLLGSRALVGALTPEEIEHPRGDSKIFAERLALVGLTQPGFWRARREPRMIKAWVEAHIEQGSRLEERGVPIGIVTGIVGIKSYWLVFQGRADHAGTTALDRRLDALQGAAEFVRQSRKLVLNSFPEGVVTCGIVKVQPGAFNIVPRRVDLALEFRHSEQKVLTTMREALLELARIIAEQEHLELDIEKTGDYEPAQMHDGVIASIEKACGVLDLPFTRLASYAGHDTQSLAKITPAGMFFVPSVNGISHNPRELTRDGDCVNAGNVLLQTILSLAESG